MIRELNSPSTPQMRRGWPTEPVGGTRWSRVTPRVRPPRKRFGGPRNTRRTRYRRCAANKNHGNPVKMRSRQRREEDGDDLGAQQPVNPANAQRLANGTRRRHGGELGYASYSTPSKNVQGPANHAKNTVQASRRKRHRRQKKRCPGTPHRKPAGMRSKRRGESARLGNRGGRRGRKGRPRKKNWSYGSIIQPRPKLYNLNSYAQGVNRRQRRTSA